MRRLFVSVLLSLSVWLAPAAAHAQTAGCQFILGFKALHDLNAGDIGDCTDSQASASNGDAQQHSTKGLMAWRKADNWTAFTNGYKTWINGPSGLVSRLNTERFSFEHDAGTLAGMWGCSTALAKISADGSGILVHFKQPWLTVLHGNTSKDAMASAIQSITRFQIGGIVSTRSSEQTTDYDATTTGTEGQLWNGPGPVTVYQVEMTKEGILVTEPGISQLLVRIAGEPSSISSTKYWSC
ncbi:MAG TPA: hypothetical protein VIR57_16115 [Chloroflexota bacterium]|jgi:hypothetical protein